MKKKPDHNNLPSEEEIRRYLSGEMTDMEKNALERKFHSSQFTLDAEEGLASLSADQFIGDIQNLKARIKRKNKKSTSIWSGPVQIAAGIILAFVCTWLLVEYINIPENVITEQKEATEIIPEPSESEENISYLEPEAEKNIKPAETENKTLNKDGENTVEEMDDNSLEIDIDDIDEETDANDNQQEPDQDNIKDLRAKEKALARQIDEDNTKRTRSSKKRNESLAMNLQDQSVLNNADTSSGFNAEPFAISPNEHPSAPITIRGQSSMGKATGAYKIFGKIMSANDLQPLQGVNVVVKGTSHATITDVKGSFTLALPDSLEKTLVISFIGYETSEFQVKDPSYVEIMLDNDVTQLSEIVVTEKGTSKNDPQITKAIPENGFRSFRKYIKSNLKYPEEANDKKTVKVEFTVEADGSLSGFKIKDLPGKAFEAEALRLLKEGPKWKPATVNGIPQQERVEIRMRFKPPKQ